MIDRDGALLAAVIPDVFDEGVEFGRRIYGLLVQDGTSFFSRIA